MSVKHEPISLAGFTHSNCGILGFRRDLLRMEDGYVQCDSALFSSNPGIAFAFHRRDISIVFFAESNTLRNDAPQPRNCFPENTQFALSQFSSL